MVLPLQITSVIIVVKSGNKFLLVQRNLKDDIFPGRWQNVGGKVELGERVEEAAKREVEEEVGLKIDGRLTFLMSYSWRKDESEPFRLGLIFLVDLVKSKKRIRLGKELDDFGWFEYKEIVKMNKRGLLIGKESPTGTFQQIKAAGYI